MGRPEIGFIGAGGMGGPMAARLAGHGFPLVVCDQNPAVRGRFAGSTTDVADCAGADIVVVMVATDDQVLAVTDALLAAVDAARPPLLLVTSTALPATIAKVAERAAVKGVAVVDAPVSGGVTAAANGTLSFMVGGAAAHVARARPILEAMGSTIVECGASGQGQAVKLLNNLVGAPAALLMAEAVSLALRLGVDPALMARAMECSSGRNMGSADIGSFKAFCAANLAGGDDMIATFIALGRKDTGLALGLARDVGLDLPVLAAINAGQQTLDPAALRDRFAEIVKG